MSSDEKALKIEKVYSQYGFGPDASTILNTEKTLDIIIEAVNELLDTHTVKEPDGLYCSYLFGHAGPCEKGKRDCQYDIDEEIYGKDTHTVKEEDEKPCACGDDMVNGFWHSKKWCEPLVQPTTPEKKCCELCECASYVDGVKTKSKCNSKDCPCHQRESEKRNDVY